MATVEVPGPIPATFLNAGGSYDKPLREVQPGFLSVLFRESEPVAKIVPPRDGVLGRRTALARWLTDPHNPETLYDRDWGTALLDKVLDQRPRLSRYL